MTVAYASWTAAGGPNAFCLHYHDRNTGFLGEAAVQAGKKHGFFAAPMIATPDKKTGRGRNGTRAKVEEALWWGKTAQSKSTLYFYHPWKQNISPESVLKDKSLGSRLLSEAREGVLQTRVYRRRFDRTIEPSACRVCGGADERFN